MQKNIYWGQSMGLRETTKRAIGAILITASLAACTTVSHTPLSQDGSVQLTGKKVVLTKYPTPDFSASTAGKAAFAVLGAIMMVAEGNEIVRTNGIEDPALKIGQGLATRLSEERGTTLVSNQNIVAASDDVQNLVSTYRGADYLLDVKTFAWMFLYFPSDWAHYRVIYSARIRLVDTSTKKVVAETLCKTARGDAQNPVTKDQLLSNNASLLKTYLDKSASDCVNLLATDILKLPGTKTLAVAGSASPVAVSPPVQTTGVQATTNTGAIAGQLNGSKPSSPAQPVITEATVTTAVATGIPPAESLAGQVGKYSYQTEHLPEAKSCSRAPRAILNDRGPGFESYTVSCDNGDALAMRCDYGQCRVLR
ncbi:hypothetical protein SAMN04515618_102190 [Collimonas sp. OK307]|uniref:hypothetical protein n=1 Tax=Collimonas sp. OK307 TaxID=1801620 RepID=UPI0008E93FE9|nr:hypothetical protein [Collimonas sp. OK307]SFH73080.1 hypothetical protein SAMN04515618_102190 [Collimonas sp. OK307]